MRNHNVNVLNNTHGRQITSTLSDRIVLIDVVNYILTDEDIIYRIVLAQKHKHNYPCMQSRMLIACIKILSCSSLHSKMINGLVFSLREITKNNNPIPYFDVQTW